MIQVINGDTVIPNEQISGARFKTYNNKYNEFTYYITDQKSFDDWVNNVPGNNYERVYIYPGEYIAAHTLDRKIIDFDKNLTRILIGGGTKDVTIINGVFSGTNKRSVHIENIHLDLQESKISLGCFSMFKAEQSVIKRCSVVLPKVTPAFGAGFFMIDNLIDCEVFVPSETTNFFGFRDSNKLTRCKVSYMEPETTYYDPTGGYESTNTSTSFSDCTSLVDCEADAGMIKYLDCQNLYNCKATVKINNPNLMSTNSWMRGFVYCDSLYGCSMTGNCTSTSDETNKNISGYVHCNDLMNCESSIKMVSNGYRPGFHTCTRLVSCRASESNKGVMNANIPQSFVTCSGLHMCFADSNFKDCYANPLKATKFPAGTNNPADTVAYGHNVGACIN